MSIIDKNWGNTTWAFLHTFVEKLNPRVCESNADIILQLIIKICTNLPCPDCSNHAKRFFNKVDLRQINTHDRFKYMLWMFHNSVNRRLGYPVQSQQIVNKYKTYSMSTALIDFIMYYAERYNTHIELGHGNNDKTRIRITNDVIDWTKRYWNAFS